VLVLEPLRLKAGLICCFLVFAIGNAQAFTVDEVNNAGLPAPSKRKLVGPSASIVKTQVLLARQGISPGEIDGMDGDNCRKAVAQFRRRENLDAGDIVDAATWQALGGGTSSDIISDYSVTPEDAHYTFSRRIPHDYARQARMNRLGYKTPAKCFRRTIPYE
jgi:peptidoglycan hydrolase-like protein with peptidoglycan-binding domain